MIHCFRRHASDIYNEYQVTGGNKGIGFATVKGLAKEFDGVVYLTGEVYWWVYM